VTERLSIRCSARHGKDGVCTSFHRMDDPASTAACV